MNLTRHLPAFFLFLTHFTLTTFGQEKVTISGYITDEESGEKLIAANLFETNQAIGTVTNTYGFYSLTLDTGDVQITFSYIGYRSKTIELYLTQDQNINLNLSASIDLETIEVIADRAEKIEERSQMSQITVPINTIKKVPALLGEVDVLKTLQLLPGVQSGGEGQSGLYVRGGSPDQNLVLLDGVPVYNVSHVLGIFSVFNADAIKNVTLTKGGFPARYGGRLSSVLEINMKEGNMKAFHGEGSIGLISSKLTLEGPIKKDKTSFLVSGRRTYADVIASPFVALANRQSESKVKPTLFFYDLNTKLNHKFNDKHRVYLSAYLGSDTFKARVTEEESVFEGGLDWGNIISSLRWNYKISNKLFSNTTLTYSKYELDVSAGFEEIVDDNQVNFSSRYLSGIEDLGVRWDLDFVPNPNHYFKTGLQITKHNYSPGALTLKAKFEDDTELDRRIGESIVGSVEYGVYVEDDISLGPLKMNLGIHASGFSVRDEFYTSLQPRVGIRYLLNNTTSLKASYSQMRQYINLLTSEALSLPTDLWVPSTDRVKPQKSWQVATGIAKTFNDQYEISLEGYYKKMDNVISFLPGASFLFELESNWEDKITQGFGESYGAELFVQKKTGQTTGWIGYTLSWNNRQFDLINGGKTYPFRYDRRHDLSIVVAHDFNDRISLSGAWIYGTGNAISIPSFYYTVWDKNYTLDGGSLWTNNRNIQSYGTKNDFRMSDYHRLDLSVEFRKPRKWGERAWVFSIYNTYWHRNPYFVLPDEIAVDIGNGQMEYRNALREVSILPIIPSFAYKFKF